MVFSVRMLMDRTGPTALRSASAIVFQGNECLEDVGHTDGASQEGEIDAVILPHGCLLSSLASLAAKLTCLLELFIALLMDDCVQAM
ncbi:MAG: hypothetical protein KatS3mg110_4429 [Pirellulaceae bacterium]|nr:MAG: hypothetical protein KatS3mg110_4429 [Pirellulaceae bacterium]